MRHCKTVIWFRSWVIYEFLISFHHFPHADMRDMQCQENATFDHKCWWLRKYSHAISFSAKPSQLSTSLYPVLKLNGLCGSFFFHYWHWLSCVLILHMTKWISTLYFWENPLYRSVEKFSERGFYKLFTILNVNFYFQYKSTIFSGKLLFQIRKKRATLGWIKFRTIHYLMCFKWICPTIILYFKN